MNTSQHTLCRPSLMAMAMACICLVLTLLGSSCERREILRPSNVHYIRVYVQDSVKNVTTGFYSPNRIYPSFAHPDIFRVVLYNPTTRRMVADRYLRQVGQDSTGYYVEGYVVCDPGEYKMMIYNTATEATLVREDSRLSESYATTNLASVNMTGRTRDEDLPPLYNAPDLLFTCVEEDIVIPHLSYADTLNSYISHRLQANTVVETYYIQISIRGAQWVTDITAEVDGLSSSKKLEFNEMSQQEAAISFSMAMAEKQDSTAVIYAVFNTFGKIPDHPSEVSVSFNIIVQGGQGLQTRVNITEDFTKYDAVHHNWLILDKEIVIPAPTYTGGGGFTPGVTKWDEEVIPIPI